MIACTLEACRFALLAPLLALPLSAQFVHIPIKRHLPENPRSVVDIASADLDGDGAPELIVGDFDGPMRVWGNDGSGVYADLTTLPGTGVAGDLSPADFDGDGDVDLICAVASNGIGIRYFRNDGSNQFVDDTNAAFGGTLPSMNLGLLDADLDGDMDVIARDGGQASPSGMRVFINDGTGTFTEESDIRLPAIGPVAVAFAPAEVNGDAFLDLVVVGSFSPYTVSTWINDGTGFFTDSGVSLPVGAPRASGLSFDAYDLDGDGASELLFGFTHPSSQIIVWRNDGTGQFTDVSAAMPATPGASHVASGDLDGDGDADLLLGPTNYLLRNDGTGTFTATTLETTALSSDTILDDLDGDGDLDLAMVRDLSPHRCTVLFNDGNAAFVEGLRNRTPILNAVAGLDAGDIDGDLAVDVVFAQEFPIASSPVGVLRNDGAGELIDETATRLPPVGPLPHNVAELFDADGTGVLHLLAGGINAPLQYYRNDGAGVFTTATTLLPPTTLRPRSITSGDIDGDGLIDLMIGEADGLTPAATHVAWPTQSHVFRQTAGGSFVDETATRMPVGLIGGTLDLELFDADGDLDLDACFGNSGENWLLLNDGTGVFVQAPFAPQGDHLLTTAVAIGDIDGDGDNDIVTGNTEQNRAYINDGLGGFTDETVFRLPTAIQYPTGAAELFDFDGDGDLDVLFGNMDETEPARIHLNDGTGHFNAGSLWFSIPDHSALVYELEVADFDGDSDTDVLAAGWLGMRICSNIREWPQLQSPWLARSGAPLRLEVHSFNPPMPPSALMLTTAALPTPVATPFGLLRIDLNQLVGVVGTPNGVFEATIPANSTLVGVDLYWQALRAQAVGVPTQLLLSDMVVDPVVF